MLDWQTEAPKTYRAPTQKSECQEWLEDFLKANPDGLPPRDIVEAGEEAGFKRAMIYEIRKHLNAQIQNTAGRQSPGNCWKWCETPLETSQQEDDD
jgi:hypothetical protein